MKYLKITNIDLVDLLYTDKNRVDWSYFGFDTQACRRLSIYGDIDSNTKVMCLPITNEKLLNQRLSILQERVDNSFIETDSIEIIEESDLDLIKSSIELYKNEI